MLGYVWFGKVWLGRKKTSETIQIQFRLGRKNIWKNKPKPGGLNLSRSQHWQRVGLDGWENFDNFKKLVLTIEKSQHPLPVPKVLMEIEKSVKTWNFGYILTVCFDLNREWVGFIILLDRDSSICQDFLAWSPSKSLYNVEILWFISKSLHKSWKSLQSQFISTILVEKSQLDLVSTVRIILTGFKSWSRQIEKSRSRSWLVSTVKTPRLT